MATPPPDPTETAVIVEPRPRRESPPGPTGAIFKLFAAFAEPITVKAPVLSVTPDATVVLHGAGCRVEIEREEAAALDGQGNLGTGDVRAGERQPCCCSKIVWLPWELLASYGPEKVTVLPPRIFWFDLLPLAVYGPEKLTVLPPSTNWPALHRTEVVVGA